MFRSQLCAPDWNDVTREDVINGNSVSAEEAVAGLQAWTSFWLYTAAKTLAERALWEFADEHPDIEVATSKITVSLVKRSQY